MVFLRRWNRKERNDVFTIFPSERNRVARDTDIDNKVLYAATNRSPVRGFEPPLRLPFTIVVTAARAHKSLYDPSLKTDFMRKWMACRNRPQPAIPRNRLGPRRPIFHFLPLSLSLSLSILTCCSKRKS